MSTFETKDYILQEDLDYIANSFPDINKLKNSTILVTGATGLVGSYAVKALAAINRIHNANMKILAQKLYSANFSSVGIFHLLSEMFFKKSKLNIKLIT